MLRLTFVLAVQGCPSFAEHLVGLGPIDVDETTEGHSERALSTTGTLRGGKSIPKRRARRRLPSWQCVTQRRGLCAPYPNEAARQAERALRVELFSGWPGYRWHGAYPAVCPYVFW